MNEKGKIITISSVKGGVGKTTLMLNLAGLYFLMKKRVLIIDLDLYAGGIATSLNINNKRDIYMLVDALSNNKSVNLDDYVTYDVFGSKVAELSGLIENNNTTISNFMDAVGDLSTLVVANEGDTLVNQVIF